MSPLFLTSALIEMSGQLHAPAALLPEKKFRYSLERSLGGPLRRSGRCGEEKGLALPGIRTPAIQLLASHYTD
jgi:hypothetical protein